MHFGGIKIEVTRDCNLNCPHCMRYEPDETMDKYRGVVIKTEYIDKLLDQTEHIGSLSFTGGEPFIYPGIISHTVDKIIENNITVDLVGVITNGTIKSPAAVEALNKMNEYCPVGLGISVGLHDNKDTLEDVYDYYKENCSFDVTYENTEEISEGKNGIALTYSGRAKKFKSEKFSTHCKSLRHKLSIDEQGTVLCMLDLTTKGNLVIAEPHSFKDGDRPENIICHVSENIMQKILLWNYRNPLNCKEAEIRENLILIERFKNYELADWISQKESFRKKMHRMYPYLYPDDIEKLSELVGSEMDYRAKNFIVAVKNEQRRTGQVDSAHYATCPK